jgi:DNA-binding response OmpR family regulator
MSRILLIEDNTDLAFGLKNNLEIEGYTVDLATEAEAGMASARHARPDSSCSI